MKHPLRISEAIHQILTTWTSNNPRTWSPTKRYSRTTSCLTWRAKLMWWCFFTSRKPGAQLLENIWWKTLILPDLVSATEKPGEGENFIVTVFGLEPKTVIGCFQGEFVIYLMKYKLTNPLDTVLAGNVVSIQTGQSWPVVWMTTCPMWRMGSRTGDISTSRSSATPWTDISASGNTCIGEPRGKLRSSSVAESRGERFSPNVTETRRLVQIFFFFEAINKLKRLKVAKWRLTV